jgi:hypothetical protein
MTIFNEASEAILTCLYIVIGGDVNAYALFWGNKGLYTFGEGHENIQERKEVLTAKAVEMSH